MVDEPFAEASKAVRAVAKSAGKAIDAVRGLGGFLNKMFGRALVSTVDLVWTDRAETRRVRNAIYDYKELAKLFMATERELQKRRAKSLKAIPAKVGIPLLEHATMEIEPRLRALWAQLLASGMAGEKIEVSYVSALGTLTGRDAAALQKMFERWEPESETHQAAGIEFESGIDVAATMVQSSAKLFGLGIIEPTTLRLTIWGKRDYDHGVSDSYEEAVVPGDLTVIKFTRYGMEFCHALGMRPKRRRKKRKKDNPKVSFSVI